MAKISIIIALLLAVGIVYFRFFLPTKSTISSPKPETAENQKATCRKSAYGTERRNAPPLLLDWLYSPQG